MKVRYVGGMLEALINGKIVKRGEEFDLPKKIAEELVARGVCEPVKPARPAEEKPKKPAKKAKKKGEAK